jgi:hypothetical protein
MRRLVRQSPAFSSDGTVRDLRSGEVCDRTGELGIRVCEALLVGLWLFGIVCLFAAAVLLAV